MPSPRTPCARPTRGAGEETTTKASPSAPEDELRITVGPSPEGKRFDREAFVRALAALVVADLLDYPPQP